MTWAVGAVQDVDECAYYEYVLTRCDLPWQGAVCVLRKIAKNRTSGGGGPSEKNPFIGDIPAAAEILWWNNLAEIALLCAVSSI